MRDVTVAVLGDAQAGKATLVRALAGLAQDAPLSAPHHLVSAPPFAFRLRLRPPGTRDVSRALRLALSCDLVIFAANAAEEPGVLWTPLLQVVDFFGLEERVVLALPRVDHEAIDYAVEPLERARRRFLGWGLASGCSRSLLCASLSALRGQNLRTADLPLPGGRGLLEALAERAQALRPPRPPSPPRLRIFAVRALPGRGCVVRAETHGAAFSTGDTLLLLPGLRHVRLASLQHDRHPVSAAEPGQLVGAHLPGTPLTALHPGAVLAPLSAPPTAALWVEVWALDDRPIPAQLVAVARHLRVAMRVVETRAAVPIDAGGRGACAVLHLEPLSPAHIDRGTAIALLQSDRLRALGRTL